MHKLRNTNIICNKNNMNNNEQINILCSTDNNYAAYCGIMLTSLYENNRNSDITVYLLTDGLSEEALLKYKQFEQRYNTTIHIITVRQESFKLCPVREGDHVNLTAYYRIACADLLPDTINKVLYLDCDIMVKCDLHSLWNTNIIGKAMGVVLDGWHIVQEERLQLKSMSYFNSGVLLINLEYFRTHRIAEKCLQYIQDFPEKIIYHDQDILNIICQNDVVFLPLKYNFQTAFLRTRRTYDDSLYNEIIKSLTEKKLIIHFDYFPKPWNKYLYMDHPFKAEWLYYRKLSLWPDAALTSPKSKIHILQVYFFKLLWIMKIKKRPHIYLV